MLQRRARRLDLDQARRDDGATFLGRSRVRMIIDVCRQWTAGPLSPELFESKQLNVPTLLVSGEFDPNMPPRGGDEALRMFPRGRHVVLRGVSHAWTAVAACGSAFVADFVTRASVAGLDVAWAERSSAPSFFAR